MVENLPSRVITVGSGDVRWLTEDEYPRWSPVPLDWMKCTAFLCVYGTRKTDVVAHVTRDVHSHMRSWNTQYINISLKITLF